MLISPACAQSLGSIAGFDFMSLLPLLLIFVVFYFFLIRPQQKKAQQQKELLNSLRRGDRIVTTGGLIGVITKVINDQELQVEIADNVRVRVARATVADLLSKTEPAADISEKTEKKKVAPRMALKKPAAKKVALKVAAKKPAKKKAVKAKK
jgi:preprotein translocase subunit YajC